MFIQVPQIQQKLIRIPQEACLIMGHWEEQLVDRVEFLKVRSHKLVLRSSLRNQS